MDQQFDLANNVKFILKENVLAFTSSENFKAVSSAIFNGGYKKVKTVLNIGVPPGYSDVELHMDPMRLITSSAVKLNINGNYLAMVTAANVHNFSLVTKKSEEFSVSVAATAGCSHGESSGENIEVEEITGTINIIVLIDGNPTESCMVAALITATEAKSAVLRDFDMRSRYTGDSATGSITDSVTVASTEQGEPIILAGPASKLGKLIGYCTRKAVREALLKQEPIWAKRTTLERLRERHITVEKMATEISKIEGVNVDTERLMEILNSKPAAKIYLLAASKMDDDYRKNLLPNDCQDWTSISKSFGVIHNSQDYTRLPNYENADLPPFIKHALISIVKNA